MLQRTGSLALTIFVKRNCYSGLKAVNSRKLIKKPIVPDLGKKKAKVANNNSIPYYANRQLDLDVLKPEASDSSAPSLPPILTKPLLVPEFHLGESDCGEGGPDRPTRGPCDPPEGPCVPMKKPGYPSKPRAPREPFCVKCPPKKPCNLNKCPPDPDAWNADSREIALIVLSQSQRNPKLGCAPCRNYGTYSRVQELRHVSQNFPLRFQSGSSGKDCLEPPQCPAKPEELPKRPDACAKPPETVKIVYQKCPPCPKLPKMPECVPPEPTCEAKCPPLPQYPKCPPCPPEEPPKCEKPKSKPCCSGERVAGTLWEKLTGFMNPNKNRKMSTGVEGSTSKCQTVTDICSDKSAEKKLPTCPKNRRTSCYPEVVKCPPDLEKAPEKKAVYVEEKINYSKIGCPPPKFVKLEVCPAVDSDKGKAVKPEVMGLPGPPSDPVILCPCPPPAKLHPGACPCAPEVTNIITTTSTEPCPSKPLYPCPEKRVYYCPPQKPVTSGKNDQDK